MAFLKLISNNPNLSYILGKNPSTPMMARSYKKGSLFGWYSSDTQYNIFFKEGEGCTSFPTEDKGHEFEYINELKYCSPSFIIGALKEIIKDPLKKLHEEDTEEFTHTIDIGILMVTPKYLEFFATSYPDMKIETEEIYKRVYSIKITHKGTLHKLINVVNLFASFNMFFSNEAFYIDSSIVKKYTESLNKVDSPYFIRYLFKKHMLKSRKEFNREKVLLEKSDRYDSIEMHYGGTFDNRVDKIRSLLDLKHPILDIGCGEGNYVSIFSKSLKDLEYGFYDVDETAISRTLQRCKRKNLTNVVRVKDVKDYLNQDREIPLDVLLTEVIEHNTVEEAKELVKSVLSSPNINSLIITTPCKDFNEFFLMENEFRHPDHKFEFTYNQWLEFIKSFDEDAELFNIGDVVNGVPTSVGAIFKKVK